MCHIYLFIYFLPLNFSLLCRDYLSRNVRSNTGNPDSSSDSDAATFDPVTLRRETLAAAAERRLQRQSDPAH